jgi:hypothetical protein
MSIVQYLSESTGDGLRDSLIKLATRAGKNPKPSYVRKMKIGAEWWADSDRIDLKSVVKRALEKAGPDAKPALGALLKMLGESVEFDLNHVDGDDLTESLQQAASKIKKGDDVRLETKGNSGSRVYEINVNHAETSNGRIIIRGPVYKRDKKTGSYSVGPGGSYASVDVYTDGKHHSQVVISGSRTGKVSAGTRYKLVNMSRMTSPPGKVSTEEQVAHGDGINKLFIEARGEDRQVSEDQLFEMIVDTKPLSRTVQERDYDRRLQEARYVIGAGGLEKPGGGKVSILPNRVYYLGASTSPKHIVVTKVDGDRVMYRSYPYDKEHFIQRWIAADLIEKGSTQALKNRGRYMDAKEKHSLEDLLKGGKGVKVDYKDFQPVYALVTKGAGHEDEDLWREAERYGGVGGLVGPSGKDNGPDYRYEINMQRGAVADLKKNKKFKVLKVTG